MPNRKIPNVLSIAGSDPSGGAGIQADLKTIAALGCHGMAAITALTAQNTQAVSAIHVPPASFVADQIRMVFADIEVAAVKIGMIGSPQVAAAVAEALNPHADLPIVLDPVLGATSGATFGDAGLVEAVRRHLFPLATLITPNLDEAASLAAVDMPRSRAEIEALARRLQAEAPTAWLVKGGHGTDDSADDLLLMRGTAHWLSAPRVETPNNHGTGCTLSSAVAAYLALGRDLQEAVAEAKAYVGAALAGAGRLDVGQGAGPLDHFVRWR